MYVSTCEVYSFSVLFLYVYILHVYAVIDIWIFYSSRRQQDNEQINKYNVQQEVTVSR